MQMKRRNCGTRHASSSFHDTFEKGNYKRTRRRDLCCSLACMQIFHCSLFCLLVRAPKIKAFTFSAFPLTFDWLHLFQFPSRRQWMYCRSCDNAWLSLYYQIARVALPLVLQCWLVARLFNFLIFFLVSSIIFFLYYTSLSRISSFNMQIGRWFVSAWTNRRSSTMEQKSMKDQLTAYKPIIKVLQRKRRIRYCVVY